MIQEKKLQIELIEKRRARLDLVNHELKLLESQINELKQNIEKKKQDLKDYQFL